MTTESILCGEEGGEGERVEKGGGGYLLLAVEKNLIVLSAIYQ